MLAKTKMAGLLVTLMALSVPLVYADNAVDAGDAAHQDGGWHHHGDGDKGQMMAQILNLSDDQVKQLKDNRQKDKDAMKAIFEQMKTNREAFDAEIVKAAPDMNKISDIQAKIKTIQSQMLDNRLNSLLAIKKIMTPEQFAGYMALEKAKKMMMHKGHGKFNHSDKDHDSGDQD